jgi:hypothetical protein
MSLARWLGSGCIGPDGLWGPFQRKALGRTLQIVLVLAGGVVGVPWGKAGGIGWEGGRCSVKT